MVEQPVAHAGLVDVARLGVGDFEMLIWAVAVGFIFEIAVERGDLIYQVSLKLQDVYLLALAVEKLLPRRKQIFDRNDTVVGMSELFPRVDPPPQELVAHFGARQTGLSALAWTLFYATQNTSLHGRREDRHLVY